MIENTEIMKDGLVIAVSSSDSLSTRVVEELRTIFSEEGYPVTVCLQELIHAPNEDGSPVSMTEKLSRADKTIKHAKTQPGVTLLDYTLSGIVANEKPEPYDLNVDFSVEEPDFVFNIIFQRVTESVYSILAARLDWGMKISRMKITAETEVDGIGPLIAASVYWELMRRTFGITVD